jgi:hypothetical protein
MYDGGIGEIHLILAVPTPRFAVRRYRRNVEPPKTYSLFPVIREPSLTLHVSIVGQLSLVIWSLNGPLWRYGVFAHGGPTARAAQGLNEGA